MVIREYNDASIFLETVRTVAGDEGVRKVEDARGGVSVKIPIKVTRKHWLSITLGFDDAREVAKRLCVINADGRRIGMTAFTIPLGLRSQTRQLLARAESLILSGQPVPRVAIAIGMHERNLWRLKARLVAAGKLPANSSSKTKASDA